MKERDGRESELNLMSPLASQSHNPFVCRRRRRRPRFFFQFHLCARLFVFVSAKTKKNVMDTGRNNEGDPLWEIKWRRVKSSAKQNRDGKNRQHTNKRGRNFQFSNRRNKTTNFYIFIYLFFFFWKNISIHVVRRDFWGAQRWRQKKKTENKFVFFFFLFFIRIDCVTALVWGPC